MAKITDLSGIHFKMLNKSKGPAVWSPRAQSDRFYYSVLAQKRLSQLKNLELIAGAVEKVIVKNKKVIFKTKKQGVNRCFLYRQCVFFNKGLTIEAD